MTRELESALRCVVDDLFSICEDAQLDHISVTAIPDSGKDGDFDWAKVVGWRGRKVAVELRVGGDSDE